MFWAGFGAGVIFICAMEFLAGYFFGEDENDDLDKKDNRVG